MEQSLDPSSADESSSSPSSRAPLAEVTTDDGEGEDPPLTRPPILGQPLASKLRWYAPPRRKYTYRELLADRIINFGGAGLSWLGLPVITYLSYSAGDSFATQAGFLAFGLGLVVMLNCSALYHFLCWRWEHALQLLALDHIGISSMIMGAYVPIMQYAEAWKTLAVVLVLGFAGWFIEVYKFWAASHHLNAKSGFNWLDTVQVVRYLVMGWACLGVLPTMWRILPWQAIGLYAAGGLCYTGGVPIWIRYNMEYHMAIWHGFVLAASCCFYAGNLYLVGASV